MHISLEAIMSDYKEWQRKKAAMNGAIERYTEERMADEYGRIHTDGSRSGGQPVLLPCPFCGSLPKSGDSTYGYWLIFCSDENNCLAQPSVELKTEAQAIAAWNTRQPTQSDALEAMERDRILQLFRGYADFLDAGADALPDLQAMANIGGASHIRQLCNVIERNEHQKAKQ